LAALAQHRACVYCYCPRARKRYTLLGSCMLLLLLLYMLLLLLLVVASCSARALLGRHVDFL
jgi:hypothetical protein